MKDDYNTPWRLISTAIYTAPSDGKVFGTLEADVTDVLRYIQRQKENGLHLTVTHIVTAVVARALAYDAPDINCFVRRGRLVPRDYVDVAVAVNIKGGREMASIVVRNAHQKTVSEIGEEIRTRAEAERQGDKGKSMQSKYLLSKVPWPLRRWLFKLIRGIVNGLGIQLKSLGLSDRSFGSILVTNIGSHGLSTAYAALFPAAKLPAVIVMGKIEEKPVVRDGEIIIRSILPISATFDHRVADANQISRLAQGALKLLAAPEKLESVEATDV
ncbi:MAG: 2-oxo acid dehydrogenase subunit E2 [Candidatus Marinimicrobia bacterium]|nr:2-oxo acid dehydrogenase subunit E2 [Candidatus Neomarinimicrobiota bacterium]